MGQHLLRGDPPVQLVLRRSGRARRISLRISSLDGRVTLTVPNGVPDSEALDFAQSKAAWIRSHIAGRPDQVNVQLGAEIPVEGMPRRVVAATGRRVELGMDWIAAPHGREARSLNAFLKELARDRLLAASDYYAARLGRGYARITMRDTRSRWGSCSSQGALNYSWRLILAPGDVLRYVAAHEVAHLAEMNHSPAFWALVEKLHGPYEAQRTWLRVHGAALHRYRFEDHGS